ncbi:hypothetical protein NPIL_401641 [Nephila pilipes]|uniref:Uncharacterized protein n=1 Tax=Nephila pilipes TaxID=299642 RepID=A0A8X6T6B3_NEPPI|nr:hypothetical protein NPIL_401641 [Nephila pilipes]
MFLIENRSSSTYDMEELNSRSLNKRIKYRTVDSRYRVNLPWRIVGRKRYEGLAHRFECHSELSYEYKDVIDDNVEEGLVERTCASLSNSQGF